MFKGRTYQEICANFRWEIPEFYNIGVDISDKWAGDASRTALIYIDERGRQERYTYRQLSRLSNRLAQGLQALGVEKGDRVGVLLPSTPEALLAHLAVYKAGAVLVPLLHLFGPLAVEYRLRSSGAKVAVTDSVNLGKIMEVRSSLPELEKVIVVGGGSGPGTLDFHELLMKGGPDFRAVPTLARDPALIIYTSGTTGPPKGALHAHGLLLAEVVNLGFSLNLYPQEGDVLWTHCDWAYIAGSFTALYPCLHGGSTIVEQRRTGRFDPRAAFRVISECGVSCVFAIATAVRMMRREVESPRREFDLSRLRSITVGGETMGQDLFDWGREALGVEFTENYGLTECDFTIANCSALMEVRPGSMGRAIPGHRVEIIDPLGHVLGPDTYGEIAIQAPDPSLFLGYWRDPEATAARYAGPWFRTGDFGTKDQDGYFWFIGREDEVIESGGYRIGPGEIEDALKKHPAVSMAAAIGVPHPIKGEVVKAYLVLRPGVGGSPELAEEIRGFVRTRLEAHAYPREIEFVADLPVGNTGKVLKKELKRLDAAKRGEGSAEDQHPGEKGGK